ncbi:hypothetical protein FQR65_LT09504 [Abscondita terminalis]|nr:hypothetical protein FQR65_LT09504 [Abscondita terminalis]
MLINLLAYFEQEKDNGVPLIPLTFNVCSRVATALGISIDSVKRIKSDHRSNPIISSPGKKRSRKKSKSEDLPESSKMCIRNTLYTKKQHVTVNSLNDELKNKHILLNRALYEIGFKFKKDDHRRSLIEKSHITTMRIKFLQCYMQNLKSEYPREVVFMDEKWIFNKGSLGRSWQDDCSKSVRKSEGYDGKRFIVVPCEQI